MAYIAAQKVHDMEQIFFQLPAATLSFCFLNLCICIYLIVQSRGLRAQQLLQKDEISSHISSSISSLALQTTEANASLKNAISCSGNVVVDTLTQLNHDADNRLQTIRQLIESKGEKVERQVQAFEEAVTSLVFKAHEDQTQLHKKLVNSLTGDIRNQFTSVHDVISKTEANILDLVNKANHSQLQQLGIVQKALGNALDVTSTKIGEYHAQLIGKFRLLNDAQTTNTASLQATFNKHYISLAQTVNQAQKQLTEKLEALDEKQACNTDSLQSTLTEHRNCLDSIVTLVQERITDQLGKLAEKQSLDADSLKTALAEYHESIDNTVNQSQTQLAEQLGHLADENRSHTESLQEFLSEQQAALHNEVKDVRVRISAQLDQQGKAQINKAESLHSALTEHHTSLDNAVSHAHTQLAAHLNSLGKDQASSTEYLQDVFVENQITLNNTVTQAHAKITDHLDHLGEQQTGATSSLQTVLTQSQKTLENTVKLAQTQIEEHLDSMSSHQAENNSILFGQIGGLIQNLKIDNAVELTNSLANGKELTIENDDFVKHLGECKVSKIEDKSSGQTTEIIYEDNKKVASQTFADGALKYRMTFDDRGRMVKGEEFDDHENLIFEYQYNSAGEVVNRVEF
ncbi:MULTISPECIES: hypothetical protein [unclassified Endozoicomonas]|uniref:hypothetical protein n=2 Tax=Endozoicomonas TaxID=305899 RepID=UPI003BB5A5BA